jgi:hypothetical protein
MLKGNDEQALQEVESPQFVPGSPDGPADNDLTYNPPGNAPPARYRVLNCPARQKESPRHPARAAESLASLSGAGTQSRL